ncbi:TetR family transcriptional regulator, partial [Escherichia coli]
KREEKAILSAALDTFSQFGFHGTRLQQMQSLAGVSKRLPYYFPSKRRCILPCCGRFSISGWHR